MGGRVINARNGVNTDISRPTYEDNKLLIGKEPRFFSGVNASGQGDLIDPSLENDVQQRLNFPLKKSFKSKKLTQLAYSWQSGAF